MWNHPKFTLSAASLAGVPGLLSASRVSAGNMLYGRCYTPLRHHLSRCRDNQASRRNAPEPRGKSGETTSPDNRGSNRRRAAPCAQAIKRAMRLLALSRLTVVTVILLTIGLGSVPLCHEIVTTIEILEGPREVWQRKPEEEWGYIPVLAQLPKSVRTLAYWIDGQAEDLADRIMAPPRGRQSSYSAHSVKLAVALTGLILIPLAGTSLVRAIQRRAAENLRHAGFTPETRI